MPTYQLTNLTLLLAHGLLSVALLGAITHQCVGLLWGRRAATGPGFGARYLQARSTTFALAVPLFYTGAFILGAVLYPEYRIESRYALEEMRLMPIVGLFELKEHWAAIGLGLLPLYFQSWREDDRPSLRFATTLTLGFIVWFTFLTGHIVNNARGV